MDEVEWCVLDVLPDPAVGIDSDGLIARVSPGAAALLGRPAAELLGRPARSTLGDLGLIATAAALAREADAPWRGPDVLWDRTGPVAVDARVASVPLGRHGAVGAVVVLRDTTDDDRRRRELEQAAALVDASLDAMWTAAADGTITSWSAGAERLYGYRAGQAIGASLGLIVPLDGQAELAEIVTDVVRGGPPVDRPMVGLRCDAERFEMRIAVGPLVDRSGRVTGTTLVARDVTAERDAEHDRQRWRAMVECSGDAIVSESLGGVVMSWNPAAERLYGYRAEDVLGRPVPIVPPERADEAAEIMSKVAAGSATERLETLRRHRDGRRVRVVIDIRPLVDRTGRVLGAASVARELAAERHVLAAYRRSDFGMVMADLDGVATAVNPAMCRLLDRAADELLGRSWAAYSHPDDLSQTAEMLSAIRRGRDSYSNERRYLRPDGSVVWMRETINVVRDDGDRPLYLLAQLQDVTDRKRMDEEVEHLAYHDGLTGLPNRTLLEDRLDHALAVSTRNGSQVGVMFLDLDGFKHVNDARGHAAGDRLLVEVGDRLLTHVRPSDTVARFGGDEFVLVLDETNPAAIGAVADRVIRAMREPFSIDGDPVAMHASVGIALSRRGSRPASLLSEADAAMYRAKELGRDQAVVFDDSLRRRAEDMLQGERALRRAIEEREFVAHYQPVVDLTDGATVGVEALARWRQADGSLVPPYRFIPLAETSGLIVDLGRSILEQATSEVAHWNAHLDGRAPLWVSVNLSARQLDDGSVADMIDRVLGDTGFPPELLHLEITETVVMHNVRQSIRVLERLKSSGVQISIDDFGTGYSSLAYLQNLPVDTLKIDRSFVTHDPPSEHDLSIVKAIIGLTDALGMISVAEGIETDTQRSLLIDLGCRFGQGYLWCPPLAPGDAYRWARSAGPAG